MSTFSTQNAVLDMLVDVPFKLKERLGREAYNPRTQKLKRGYQDPQMGRTASATISGNPRASDDTNYDES